MQGQHWNKNKWIQMAHGERKQKKKKEKRKLEGNFSSLEELNSGAAL